MFKQELVPGLWRIMTRLFKGVLLDLKDFIAALGEAAVKV